ncbi:MAG: LUD domain-containing protein [Flavobacteriales bacterium]|nr:LUD domain-containing protein [Flavobacteriales bacterium]MCB9448827.1 LUD domain-containing protein [Flavobacteriales bacterium]
MQDSTSKEKILKKIRKALIQKNDSPYTSLDYETNVFPAQQETLDITFAQAFVAVGGQFQFCESLEDLADGLRSILQEKKWDHFHCFEQNLKEVLDKMNLPYIDNKEKFDEIEACITTCEFLVARTGTIVTSSAKSSGRKLPAFTPAHIVIASSNQLLYNMDDCLEALRKKYDQQVPSMISAITGPSRTADIEKTLIIGAHGPKEIYVFLLDAGNA